MTPVYGESRGPVLDLEAELNGCAVFLSARELADALATRGVLDWQRVREVLEAKGWTAPETLAVWNADVDSQLGALQAERDEAVDQREKIAATVSLLKEREPATREDMRRDAQRPSTKRKATSLS